MPLLHFPSPGFPGQNILPSLWSPRPEPYDKLVWPEPLPSTFAQVFRLVLKTSRHRDTCAVNSTRTSRRPHSTPCIQERGREGSNSNLSSNQFQPIAKAREALSHTTRHFHLTVFLGLYLSQKRIRRKREKPHSFLCMHVKTAMDTQESMTLRIKKAK